MIQTNQFVMATETISDQQFYHTDITECWLETRRRCGVFTSTLQSMEFEFALLVSILSSFHLGQQRCSRSKLISMLLVFTCIAPTVVSYLQQMSTHLLLGPAGSPSGKEGLLPLKPESTVKQESSP